MFDEDLSTWRRLVVVEKEAAETMATMLLYWWSRVVRQGPQSRENSKEPWVGKTGAKLGKQG